LDSYCALRIGFSGTINGIYSNRSSITRDARVAAIEAFNDGDTDKLLLLYPDKDRAAEILLTTEQQRIYNYQDQGP
jgi:hypothetical protein